MSAPRSVLAGLIGAGIQASRTPALHEHEGDAQGIRYLYRLIDLDLLGKSADDLEFLLAAASDLGFTGLNITFPCKQAIIPLLDELSAEARGIGAVNTVVLRDGRRIGHNTDCLGFAEGFRSPRASSGWPCSTSTRRGPRPSRTTSTSTSARHERSPAATWPAPWATPRDWSTPPRWAWPSCPACRCRRNCCAPTCGSPR